MLNILKKKKKEIKEIKVFINIATCHRKFRVKNPKKIEFWRGMSQITKWDEKDHCGIRVTVV